MKFRGSNSAAKPKFRGSARNSVGREKLWALVITILALNKIMNRTGNAWLLLQDFIMALSILARGSEDDKLLWIFSLYDLNSDGIITRDELLDVITSVYGLMGRDAQATTDAVTAKEQADRVFQVSSPSNAQL